VRRYDQHRPLAWAVGMALVVASLVVGGRAATAAPTAPAVHALGLVPRHHAPLTSATSINPNCIGCTPPLSYGGDPVMGGTAPGGTPGSVVVTPVFWAPAPYVFPSSYKTIINRYLSDVAAASGSTTNAFAVANQYFQVRNGRVQWIHVHVTAAAELDVSAGFSSAGGAACTNDPTTEPTLKACVTDAQLVKVLTQVAGSKHLAVDDTHLYAVFFPPTVATCEAAGSDSSAKKNANQCSTNAYCGYHSEASIGSAPLIYANLPYADLSGCADPWNGAQAPNGDPYADAEVSVLSHELNESITDYTGSAWTDAQGNEDGDECADVFGTPLGSTDVPAVLGISPSVIGGTFYNQVLNGDRYYTQEEFSNADWAAGRGDLTTSTPDPNDPTAAVQATGCVGQLGAALGAAVTSAPEVGFHAGVKAKFSITSSGYPMPKLSLAGALPKGLQFTDSGSGTAQIAGTPAAAGSYRLTITADNGGATPAHQNLTLTVTAPPKFTSAASATILRGAAASVVITTSGFPAPALSERGLLPRGVSFTDRHNGSAVLSGVAAGTAGATTLTITAHNLAGTASMRLRLTVR